MTHPSSVALMHIRTCHLQHLNIRQAVLHAVYVVANNLQVQDARGPRARERWQQVKEAAARKIICCQRLNRRVPA